MSDAEQGAGTPSARRKREIAIAVLLPCYNEAESIRRVIEEFRAQLPSAAIYVFDNNSTDGTAEEAARAGATVRFEPRKGKGYVIRSMFRSVEADVYVMADGDGTYPANRVRELIRPILAGQADVVIGSRLLEPGRSRFKVPNLLGNVAFRALLSRLFGVRITDVLSGYRAFSRAVVKGLPFFSRGFESETELTVKCLERGYRTVEIPVVLSNRMQGTYSKIHLMQDGVLILRTILALTRDYKPLTAFGLIGLALVACGLIPGAVVIRDFFATGRVDRLPSAIVAVGFVLAGLYVGFMGLVLHTIARRFQELDFQLRELSELLHQVRDRDEPSTTDRISNRDR